MVEWNHDWMNRDRITDGLTNSEDETRVNNDQTKD
jgi:hypothetical protein